MMHLKSLNTPLASFVHVSLFVHAYLGIYRHITSAFWREWWAEKTLDVHKRTYIQRLSSVQRFQN